jgi:hypothetical protein
MIYGIHDAEQIIELFIDVLCHFLHANVSSVLRFLGPAQILQTGE